MAHRSEDLEERVDTGSTMAVTEGDLFCDKQMTPNKNLRAANPKKRGEPEAVRVSVQVLVLFPPFSNRMIQRSQKADQRLPIQRIRIILL